MNLLGKDRERRSGEFLACEACNFPREGGEKEKFAGGNRQRKEEEEEHKKFLLTPFFAFCPLPAP